MLKLPEFLKQYFDTEYKKFEEVLEEKSMKEAFLQAFISGFECNLQITLDLDDNIVEIANLHRSLPKRLKVFLDHWKNES